MISQLIFYELLVPTDGIIPINFEGHSWDRDCIL